MKTVWLVPLGVTVLGLASSVAAQDHAMGGMQMPGMAVPMAIKSNPKKVLAGQTIRKKPVAASQSDESTKKLQALTVVPPMQMDGMATMNAPADAAKTDHAMGGMQMQPAHDHAAMDVVPDMQATGTALPAGDSPAPPLPTDHYADRFYPDGSMSNARHKMMRGEGGQTFAQVIFNLAELQVRHGRNGYRWDGEAWFGGDINRLTLKTEGSGVLREGIESAELQALYSRAIGPYFNLQAGVRHDFQPSPTRTYATVGFEGLAPYMFEVSGAAFLSEKGDLLGRLEGYYDQRITQRLILQPRIELNFSAQDVPENRYGAGLVNAELGLRLRYEIVREFAPYIGISYEAKTGRSADFARADGQDPTITSFVAGVHFWF